jgi:hypothetical protein
MSENVITFDVYFAIGDENRHQAGRIDTDEPVAVVFLLCQIDNVGLLDNFLQTGKETEFLGT